jgi:hypothetical protein
MISLTLKLKMEIDSDDMFRTKFMNLYKTGDFKLSIRRLHQALFWLCYGSLKGLLGPQSFCRSTPDFLFRVVYQQIRRLEGIPLQSST